MIKDRNLDLLARKQYTILHPDVAANSIVNGEDISAGTVAAATLVKTLLDYPRNLLYTLADNSSNTLEAVFTVVGEDQFGEVVTEVASVDYSVAATTDGTQIFSKITSIKIVPTNNAASDTASVGVSITADVASFGLPDKIGAITDVKNVVFDDAGTVKVQNIDSTSVVLARNCFRPEQTVAAADNYIIIYKSTGYR
jgi:hypothetical protein